MNDGISDVKSKGVYFLTLRISLTLYNKGGETEIEDKKNCYGIKQQNLHTHNRDQSQEEGKLIRKIFFCLNQ